MRVQEHSCCKFQIKQQKKKVMWSPLGVIFFKKRMILLLKMGWFMKSSPHTPSPTKTALAAVISGCRGGLLWDACLAVMPLPQPLSRCSQDQPTCSTGGGGGADAMGKAGSCGARRLIRVVAMFVLCSLYLGKRG